MPESVMDLVFDFSVPWFWITLVIAIFLFLIYLFLVHEFNSIKYDDITSPVLVLTIYLITSALYAAVYIQSVRKEPAYDFGFYLSIMIATFLFYISGILFLIFLIRSIVKINHTDIFFYNFILSLYFYELFLLSYSLAYSSPSGVFLSIIQLVFCMWQTKLVPNNYKSNKPKTE